MSTDVERRTDLARAIGELSSSVAAIDRQTAELFRLARQTNDQIASLAADVRVHLAEDRAKFDVIDGRLGKMEPLVKTLEEIRQQGKGAVRVLAIASALGGGGAVLALRAGLRKLGFDLGAVALLVALAGAAHAAECDTQLALAVDVSSSVNAEEYRLQMDGIAAALVHPRVVAAAVSGPARCTDIALFQWSSVNQQHVALGWTRLDGADAAEAIAGRIAAAPREIQGGSTSVSDAIHFALGLFAERPCARCRRVLDVSGDGSNNSGPAPEGARDQADAAGVTINALAILNDEPDLAAYFRGSVVTPGGAVWQAASYQDFGDAILSKLIQEVAWSPPARWAAR